MNTTVLFMVGVGVTMSGMWLGPKSCPVWMKFWTKVTMLGVVVNELLGVVVPSLKF